MAPLLAQASPLVSGYPDWLVIAVAIVIAVVALWILGKLLKWTLYLVLIVLLVGAIGTAFWYALQALHLMPAH
jgi:hypothetical protein